MKKIYAIFAAALFSASIFAAAPTKADLQSYMKADHYVACFSTPADATCNDIVWVGNYNGWNLQDEDIIVCEPLTAFPGYYVAVVPVVDGKTDGKPVQKNECGQLEWAYQNGNAAAITLVSGSVDINDKGAEADLVNWSTTEPTVIEMTAWKEGNNPCTKQCAAQDITVRLYDPFCEENPEFEPTIMGSFPASNWQKAVKMTFKESYYEYVIQGATSTLEFKFNNGEDGVWANQFEFFTPEDEENDVPAKWSTFENFKLNPEDAMSKYYKLENNVMTFNFADPDSYRYAMCGVDTNTYKVVLIAKFPADSLPEAGIEVMGNFGGDATWENGVMMELATPEPGIEYYITTKISAKAAHEFKFREAGDPDWNQVVTISDGKDLQFKFGDKWEDDKWKGEDVKLIDLDLSDPTKYCWKTNWVEPQGIENVVLTEKAQKVVVDGVLYIVRDNKMFNVQGTQVR